MTPDYHKTEFTLCTHCRDHIQSETRSGAANHRRHALRCPSSASVMIGTNTGFITKEYFRFHATGSVPNLRIFCLKPALDCFGLLLVGTPYGSLRSQSQLCQQAAHRGLAQLYTKTLVDHLSYHLRCPQRIGEFQLKRILHSHSTVNPLHGRTIQLSGSSASFACIQRAPASITILRQPYVYGCAVDAKRSSGNFGTLPILHTGHRSFSQLRQRLMVKPTRIAPHVHQYNKNY